MNLLLLKNTLDNLPPEIIPGCACEVRVHGRTVFRQFNGYSDYELTRHACETDVYRIYSCSKVFTAVAVMRLVEQGKLGLYDYADLYLPEFASLTVVGGTELNSNKDGIYDPTRQKYVSESSEKGPHSPENRMRIYDLLRMSSGFSYEISGPGMEETLKDPNLTIREFVRALSKTPLLFEPGTDFLYSFSIDILGAIIEIVSGMTLGEYMETEMFSPLSLQHTGFWDVENDVYKLAAQYIMNDDQKSNRPLSGNAFVWGKMESGGGGLKSTLWDMSTFASVLANGGTTADGYRLLSQETIDLMRKDHLDDHMKASFHRNWPHLCNYSYGLGVRTFIGNEDGNGGSTGEFGWEGAPGTYLIIDPEKAISCAFMMHVRKCSFATSFVHRQITRALYAE